MVISGLVISYVFNFLFSNSLPAIAKSLGISGLETSILANSSWAWLAIVIVSAWQACPGALIIYLAGLLAIPPDVYEAASIDGASSWRAFRSITFPLIFGYLVINTILGLQGIPERVRNHRRPDQRRSGYLHGQRGDVDLHRIQRR